MLHREMSEFFDQDRMSNGPQSKIDKILDLMYMIMGEKHEIAHQLEQAHQQIRELTYKLEETTRQRDTNTRELTNLLKQAIREKNDLAHQLEQAHQQIHELTHQLEKTTHERDTNTRELTNRLKQAIRERNDLVHQLKQARFEGEASSLSANLEELTYESICNWFVRECLN